MNPVDDSEPVSRLLFYPQMIDADNNLQSSAFPMDEIVEKEGRSISVDRCKVLGPEYHDILDRKATHFAKEGKNRSKHGYALAVTGRIHKIVGKQNEQLFMVSPDKIHKLPPDPWDDAHAKLTRMDPNHNKGYLRSYRDKLCELFSENFVPFQI